MHDSKNDPKQYPDQASAIVPPSTPARTAAPTRRRATALGLTRATAKRWSL